MPPIGRPRTKQRVRVFYSGHVQGVGFRLTAEETARNFPVRGWVRNLRDGRVELVAEGQTAVLTQFLEAVRQGPMKNFIKDVKVSWGECLDEFTDFEIRYF